MNGKKSLVINFLIMANNKILIKQNLPQYIDMLKAQRHLYDISKRWNTAQLILCVIVVLIINFIKVLIPNNGSIFGLSCEQIIRITTAYSSLILIVQIWLKSKKDHSRNLAARIQQKFDCNLFGLKWNNALCGNEPEPEDINENKGKLSDNGLTDWYSLAIEPLSQSLSALVCMRTNVAYDMRIRTSYKRLVDIVLFIIIAALLVLSAIKDLSLWNIIINWLIPLLPVFKWTCDVHAQNNANLNALNRLKILIKRNLEEAIKKKDISKEALQEIQNFIFLHRNTSYPIPSWYYKLNRNKSENNLNYSAEQIVSKLK